MSAAGLVAVAPGAVLGALTTFSAFSAESVTLSSRGQYLWALGHIGAHLLSSIALTVLGILTFNWLRS